jgi:hypothetical protein
MTDRADPAASVRAYHMNLATDLAIALTREAEHHNRQLSRIDELIDVRIKGVEAEVEARISELRGGLSSELDAELQRSQRTGCHRAVLGLLATVFGAFLLFLTSSMAEEMSRMTNYMESMRDDIGAIRLAMYRMDESTSAMAGDIKAMTGSLTAMTERMSNMNATMALLHQETAMMRMNVGAISNETRSMGGPFRFMSTFMPW